MSEKPKEKTYTDEQITIRLQNQLPAWELKEGWLRRKYQTPGWPHTLMAVNAIGYIAEAAFHHPDLNVSWGHLTVKLQTHSAGGITDKDFELAQKIEQALTWLPGEGSSFEGFEKGFKKKWIR